MRRLGDTGNAAVPEAGQLSLFAPSLPAEAAQPAAAPRPADPAPRADPAEELSRRLGKHLSRPLAGLVLTTNRQRMFSARRDRRGAFALRLQRCFAVAPDDLLALLAGYLEGTLPRGGERAAALARFRAHFAEHGPPEAPPRPRPVALRAAGRHHHLGEIRDRLAGEYFGGRLEVAITWGRRRRTRRRQRTIRLGSFRADTGVIRIHPALDRAAVPAYVVESVVYHEMLHADLPVEHRGGRRRVHTAEFRRRERLYRHFERAERWIARHFARLVAPC